MHQILAWMHTAYEEPFEEDNADCKKQDKRCADQGCRSQVQKRMVNGVDLSQDCNTRHKCNERKNRNNKEKQGVECCDRCPMPRSSSWRWFCYSIRVGRDPARGADPCLVLWNPRAERKKR